jgi:hypothetical protein
LAHEREHRRPGQSADSIGADYLEALGLADRWPDWQANGPKLDAMAASAK